MKLRLGLLAVLLVAIAPLLYGIGTALAIDPGDFTYTVPVTITNQTGEGLTDYPVRVEFNADDLVDGGYLDAAGEDMGFAGTDNVIEDGDGMAQDLQSNPAGWWLHVDSLNDGASKTAFVYLDKSSGSADREQPLRIYGASDTVGVSAAAALDLTTGVTLTVSNLRFHGASTTQQYLVRKNGAYELGVTDTDDFYFRLVDTAVSTTTGIPNGAGFAVESWDNNTGCAANPDNYTCVDDSVGAPDDITTYVQSLGATFTLDYYDLATPAGVTDPISQIDVVGRYLCTAGNTCRWAGGVRLGGIDVYGATQTTDVASTWETHTSTNVARPGGGIWTVSDLASLQLISRGRSLAPNFSHTQNYIVVHYNTATTLLYSTVAVDTDYASVAADFDGTTMSLLINGATVASGASGFATISTSASDLTIGDGTPLRASLGRVQVASPGGDVVDLDFDAGQVSESTIAGDTYQGIIEDQSGNNLDAVYSFIRPQGSITADVGAMSVSAGSPVPLPVPGVVDVVGPPLPTDGIFDPAPATGGALDWVRDLAALSGLPPEGWFWIVAFLLAQAIGAGLNRFFPSVTLAFAGQITVYLFVMLLGDTYSAWPIILQSFWSVGIIPVHLR